MRRMGRDIDESTLRSGLPLPTGGKMTPELAIRAAAGQEFRAMLTRQGRLKDLPVSVLPAVLFLSGRDACVLISHSSTGDVEVLRPSQGPLPVTLPADQIEADYSGHALVLQGPSQTAHVGDASANVPRRWFWGTVFRNWPDYMQVILASAVVNALALVVPMFTMNVYDRVFPNAAITTLWSLVAGVAIALLLDAGLKGLRAGIVDKVGRRVDLVVSSLLFQQIAGLKLENLDRSSGALMNSLKDYEQVRDFFGSQTVASMTDLVFSVLFVAVIAYIGGPLALPPAVALLVTLCVGIGVLIPLRRASNDARQTSGNKNAVVVEAVTDLETLKAVAGQGRMQHRWETQVAASATAQERSRWLATFATTVTSLLQQMSSIGIVIIGVYMALNGQLTMGAVIASVILSGRAMAPMAALSGLFLRGSYALSTLRNLDQLMALGSDSSRTKHRLNAQIHDGEINLDQAGLRYPGAEVDAMEVSDLTVQPKECIGIVGPVGAGKTSLVRLLAGLYEPTSGMVRLDGINMKQLSTAQLRSAVQLVPQEAVLFSGSLAENIAFGLSDARDVEILRAAKLAGVDQIAMAHPQGYGMQITERGRNLSGGQRQMVALARALLQNPKVLILDEPTSSMDQANEARFVKRLSYLLAHRPMTLIISTHRRSLLSLTTRLLVLDQGKILHDGPRDQVLTALKTPTEEKAT
ncbi:type I secretion system permease/ATPase [Pukyongiella litopenaei]|uniref:Type I secretion system permease/ATPase n=2 Tax=Paracoccaceae TaxID=31989 RepID=A0A2S0MTS4_9RHOB|nr:type I secretion system permease/ATPase [Pukyongiella litopenaei]